MRSRRITCGFTCTLACAAALALAACGGGTSSGTDGSAGGSPDMTAFPAECTGTLTGAIEGRFGCKLSMSNQPEEQDLHFATMSFVGDTPKQLLLLVVAPGEFTAKKYTLADLVGTALTATNKLSATYAANNDGPTRTGNVTLTVATPPSPPAGAMTWTDTAMHGTLEATLPADPNTPAVPGTKVDVRLAF